MKRGDKIQINMIEGGPYRGEMTSIDMDGVGIKLDWGFRISIVRITWEKIYSIQQLED